MNVMRSWLTISPGDVKHPTPTTGGFLLMKTGRTGGGRARMDFTFYDEKGMLLYTHAKEAVAE